MRIFVTGPGRCGTCTFFQAVSNAAKRELDKEARPHVTNYSCGHETKNGDHNVGDWNYHDDHVEVASQLVIGLPTLITKYPNAKWIHLFRDRKSNVESLAKAAGRSMDSFANQFWYFTHSGDRWRAAEAFYDFCKAQCEALMPKEKSFTMYISRAESSWKHIWEFCEFEGNFEASKKEWLKRYNTKDNRGRNASNDLQ